MAVADFFHLTLDEICGLNSTKDNSEFMERLIGKTDEGEIVWIPCADNDMLSLGFCPMQLKCDFDELYCTDYNAGRIYIGYKHENPELYISLGDNVCVRQHEKLEQLRNLWKVLKG